MGVKAAFHNTGVYAGEFGDALAKAFKPSTYRGAGAAAQGAPAHLVQDSGLLEKTVKVVTWPVRKTFTLGAKIIELPVTLAIKTGNGGLKHATNLLEKHPGKSLIATGAVAVVGGATLLARHNAKKLAAQGEAVDQLQAMQAATPIPQQVSYMNSASQADVDARIAADRAAAVTATGQDNSVGNHTAAVNSARQQPAETAASAVPL